MGSIFRGKSAKKLTFKIKKALEPMKPDPGTHKDATIRLYAHGLKYISNSKDASISIDITEQQALGKRNPSFNAWKNRYNKINLRDGPNFEIINTIRSVLGNNGRHIESRNRMKKKSMKVYEIFKKAIEKDYSIKSLEHKEFWTALRAALFAYREAIIKLRCVLKIEYYKLIPDDLKIMVKDGEIAIKNLYEKCDSEDYYQLSSQIKLSEKDKRNIQLKIYPYIFGEIYIQHILNLEEKYNERNK